MVVRWRSLACCSCWFFKGRGNTKKSELSLVWVRNHFFCALSLTCTTTSWSPPTLSCSWKRKISHSSANPALTVPMEHIPCIRLHAAHTTQLLKPKVAFTLPWLVTAFCRKTLGRRTVKFKLKFNLSIFLGDAHMYDFAFILLGHLLKIHPFPRITFDVVSLSTSLISQTNEVQIFSW